MKTKQLIKIDPDKNNNRILTMQEDGQFFYTWVERVNDSSLKKPVRRPFPISMWNMYLQQKLDEGYQDRSVLSGEEMKTQRKYKEISDPVVLKFWEDVKGYSRKAIKDNYSIQIDRVTLDMLNRAQEILDHIRYLVKIGASNDALNKELLSLFALIPRKMLVVADYLFRDDIPAQDILYREQEILNVMKAEVRTSSLIGETELDALGLSIRKCHSYEKNFLMDMMGNESKYYTRAFRVKNFATHDLQKKYIERRNLRKEDVHQLFHGSRNMNVYGLITEGPRLHPNAIRTGSLFGTATYFGVPKQAHKPMRYTDFLVHGLSYTGGTSNHAYLFVYDVAYNNPMHLTRHTGSGVRMFTKENIYPYDVVHAHPGYDMGARRLINDEIMSYDPEGGQVDIHYVIELGR